MMQNLSADEVISNWLPEPKELASRLIEKYGQPNEMSTNMLVWYNNGPWKRTVLHNEELPHNSPKPHTDMLENVIDYQVPPKRASDLDMFDGSVIFDRTAGEMWARCDNEAMNMLALNLANDVITGKRSVEDARMEYGKQAMARMMGQSAPYTESLQFMVPHGGTADPDQPVVKAA